MPDRARTILLERLVAATEEASRVLTHASQRTGARGHAIVFAERGDDQARIARRLRRALTGDRSVPVLLFPTQRDVPPPTGNVATTTEMLDRCLGALDASLVAFQQSYLASSALVDRIRLERDRDQTAWAREQIDELRHAWLHPRWPDASRGWLPASLVLH